MTIHALQHAVTAALQRNVQMSAEFRFGCHKIKEFLADIQWLYRRKAQTTQAFQLG